MYDTSSLRAALRGKPRPPELSAARYDESHEFFEQSSDQQRLLLRWLSGYAASKLSENASVLSVGSGSGILDLPLIGRIHEDIPSFEYTALDPNPVAMRRFAKAFASHQLPGVRLDLRETTADAFRPEVPLDWVHAVHSLYYVPDPFATIERLRGMLATDGDLVIVHAPRAELNELAHCFWGGHGGDGVFYSDRIENHLAERGITFKRHQIAARLDVSPVMADPNPEGNLLLDFITQADSRHFGADVTRRCREYLRAAGAEVNGRWSVPHPADVFVIPAT